MHHYIGSVEKAVGGFLCMHGVGIGLIKRVIWWFKMHSFSVKISLPTSSEGRHDSIELQQHPNGKIYNIKGLTAFYRLET